MRLHAPVLGIALLLSLLAFVPAAEARPAPACTDMRPGTCPAWVCVDDDLNGKFSWDECIEMHCPHWGCCGGPCPPPYEPMSSGSATCTGYMNVLGAKQRTCVDATDAPSCGAWTEGWSMLGYFKRCYGTAALCSPQGCVVPDTEIACVDRLCLA